MRKSVQILTLCFLLFVLGACGSAKKKAKSLLDAESFDEAVRLYEQVLREDPNDVEARMGLKSARDGALDKGLISVRMARLAGNQQQATDLLLGIVQKEQSWNHSTSSKVAFTQEEESGFVATFLQGRVKTVIRDNKPILAESILFHYQSLFQGPRSAPLLDSLKKEILVSGKTTCAQYQQTALTNFPYFSNFIARYCTHFESACSTCSTAARSQLQELYHRLNVDVTIVDLPVTLNDEVRRKVQAAFETTAWYHGEGKKNSHLPLQGKYSYSHHKDLVSLVHQYQVQEPYEATEYVTLTRQIPIVEYENQLGRSVPVTRYKTEYYQEPRKVVRYRMVDKAYPYSAIKHRQELDIQVSGSCEFSDRKVDISFQDSAKVDQIESDLNLPNIGLAPSRPLLQDPNEWIQNNAHRLGQQFKERAQAEWIARFCAIDTQSFESHTLADQVQKCLRGRPSSLPSLVSQWYETHLGLSYEKAEEIFSKKFF